ncbi:efflux RND transporter periplasmic adaptor subunit [Alteraurantiacibacter aestuarii]|uniref:efflux RND transporter periplasmic adaptor subunit n=1 Tax=Alteraurantiacibacter aestuarii TaxID=650004 RepID=UPI0031D62FC0
MGAKIKRWRWAILVVALLVGGLVFAFWPAATPVDTGEVSRGPMAVGITDDGVTRAQEFYVVSAPVTGYLSRIELEAGDTATRGTLITQMTGRPSTPLDQRSQRELGAALAAARAALAGADSTLEQSRRDLARAEELASRGFLPRAQLEAARTRVAGHDSAVRQGRAEIARLQALMAAPGGNAAGPAVPVRMPVSGSILSVINESEGVIAEGTPLVTIGDPAQIEAVVDLLSREAVRVQPGDPVEITQWGGPEPLAGKVERIEPFGRLKISALGIEEQRVNVIISFDPASAGQVARLGHGYQIDATIILWRDQDALRVPIGALFRDPEGNWSVFVDDAGRARQRQVRIDHMNDEFAEVLDGLAQGDQVVLNPGNALADGMRISPR